MPEKMKEVFIRELLGKPNWVSIQTETGGSIHISNTEKGVLIVVIARGKSTIEEDDGSFDRSKVLIMKESEEREDDHD